MRSPHIPRPDGRWSWGAVLVLLAGAAVPAAAVQSQVATQARAWRAGREREIVAEFARFLAIPNVVGDSAALRRNAEAIRGMLESRGVAARLLELEGAPPIVVGDLAAPGATRTIAFYAHYDGQPVDPTQWTGGPWTPVVRDRSGAAVDWTRAASLDPEWRVHARSSGDDKAPIVAMVAALDALRAAGRRPSVNLRFVFEGEEEVGSPHLAAYMTRYREALSPDAWILCDGPVHQSRRMEVYLGARGVVDVELTVYGPIKGLHDGHYGNWVPNPIVMLTHLLDSMRDESGQVLIRGFYDDVVPPTPAERAAVAAVPDVERDLREEFAIGRTEREGRPLNELLMLPALNVRGIQSGRTGQGASNTIQTEARASIDFRLVPAQTPDSVRSLVERHVAAQGYTIVREEPDRVTRMSHPRLVKVDWGPGYPAARTPLDAPLTAEVVSIMTAAGHPPVVLPTVGGSIPMYLFQRPGRTPVIGLPIANHDNNQHAPNENLRLQNLWDGIELFAALFGGLGGR